ncbi:hypothetical protein V1264_008737 [Littorina saxatilis]
MSSVVTGGSSATQRPHIIVIVADDLGYNDVSFHGSDQIPTPNIDSLAYSGIVLNNYYVSPICTPTRSALMTGRHPIHTGMQHGVIYGDQPYGLPLEETLMPEYLNPLGYRSHIVGKWHLGMFAKQYTPLYRGFESHLGYYQGCEDYYDHTYEADMTQWGLDFRRDMTVLNNYTGNYSTTVFTEEAVSIIDNHDKSQPLFLYLPYQAVHSGNGNSPSPLQAPQSYIDRFPHIENKQRRIYAAMVSALDDGVGAVYAALQKNNMADNSVIVFTTDNGGPANGFDFNAANNFPLRGLKATLWEGGVRGVGFLHSPLLQKAGYVSQQMLHVCDWLPTLYEAAGGNPKKLKNLDGVSAWQMLSTNGAAIRTEMLHNIDPLNEIAGLRVGDFKLVSGDIGNGYNDWYPRWQLSGDEDRLHVDNFHSDSFDHEDMLLSHPSQHKVRTVSDVLSSRSRFSGVKDDRFINRMSVDESVQPVSSRQRSGPVTINCGPKPANASTNCQPEKSPCLFHIPSDPCEYNNIAASNPAIVDQLFQRLLQYSYTMVTPGNKPNDDRGNPKYHNNTWVPWVVL